MAELDYAFVADYASISEGKLTAIGASFTELSVPVLPTFQQVSVAGRLRAEVGFAPFQLAVEVRAPGADPVATTGQISPQNVDHVYDGKSAVLFCFRTAVYVDEPGLVEIDITIDGELVRTLKFEVSSN